MKRILAILFLFVSTQVNAQPWFWGDAGLKFINPNAKYYMTNSAGDTVVNISDKGNMGIGKNTSPTPDSSAWAPGMGLTIGGTPGYLYPYLRFKYYDGATGYNDATLGMDGTSFLFWAGSTALTNWQWWINGTRIFSVQSGAIQCNKTLLASAAVQAPAIPRYSSGTYNFVVWDSLNSGAFEKFSLSQLRAALLPVDSVTVSNDSLYEWKNGTKKFRYLHSAGGGGGVSNVTATLPLSSSGGSTPNLSFDTTTTSGGWHSYNYYKTVFANITHTHAWSDITSTPTTIAGYGITDYNSLWDTRFAAQTRIDSANYADSSKYAVTAGNAINLNGHADTYFTPANGSITGATKTKITYDSKGLVTAGADATTADIASSTDKRYVTDAQLVVIGNTSGTNTGDQTSVSGNAGTATALQTPRNIYGNSFNGSADVTGIIASTYGGTGNGFFSVSGPATSTKTYTFPNANATIARTDAGQTFTGVQTFSSSPVVSSFTNTGTHSLPTVTGTIVEYVEGNTTSASTITPTGDARQNYYDVTALATAPTFAAPSGTAANHNLLTIRIKDNGTARALTWNAIYRAGTTVSLPTTTTISKTMHVQFEYNSADTKWDLVGVVDGF